MKKIVLLISISFVLFSCQDRGEITSEPTDFIEINGKIYKLMQIVPKNGYRAIWIMYPKDSLNSQPQSINYTIQEGKHSINQTVIKVD